MIDDLRHRFDAVETAKSNDGPRNLVATPAWSAYPAGGNCKSPGCNGPGDQVAVTVTYQFPVVIPFVPRRTLSMSNTAAMVISQ